MSIYNRRNAALGWLSWLVAKRVLKKKVRQAVPGTVSGTKRPNKGAIATLVAVVVGLLWFWRRSGDDGSPGDVWTPPGAAG